MTSDRDRVLSEFIDAWNAGERPDVDDYIARVPADERGELADALVSFLSFAPTPAYSEATLEAIRADPIVAEALAAARDQGSLLPKLLGTLRTRFSITTPQLAGALVSTLGLPAEREAKTATYLQRLEHGELEPTRVSRRVFDALAQLFGVPGREVEGAADFRGWRPIAPAAAAQPVFRAEDEAAHAVAPHLELLAEALEAPGSQERDEVDELFLGGR